MANLPPPPLPTGISLRSFGDADREFSLALFREITAHNFRLAGLPDEQLEALLEQQFEIRDIQWRNQFPDAAWSIVVDGSAPIGEWCVDEQDECIALVNVALLQASRGRGIAAALVRRLFADAQRAGKYVTAHVMKENPARVIWFHLGFEIVEDVGACFRIEWHPPQTGRADQ